MLAGPSPAGIGMLAASAMAQDLDAYPTQIATLSPLGYWKLNEASGTSLADSSGNSNTATLTVSSVNYRTNGPGPHPALEYADSGNRAISAAGAFDVFGDPNQEFTFECWTKPSASWDGDSTGHALVVKVGGNNWCDLGFPLGVAQNGKPCFQLHHGVSTAVRVFGDTRLDVGGSVVWSHIVGMRCLTSGTHATNELRIYVDGVNTDTAAYGNTNDASDNGADLEIGDRVQGAEVPPNGNREDNYIGHIAHVAVYDYALSDAEVLANYNAI